jgi:Zn-dependent M28 family amino/carboxypeptidase
MTVAGRISEAEMQGRTIAVDNAVAQQELEGLTVSPEAVEDMRNVARGEMTVEQAIANVHARLPDAALLGS